MYKIKKYIFVFFVSLLPSYHIVLAQTSELILHARQLESIFKDQEALFKYLEVLKTAPQNLESICKISELYSLLGKRQKTSQLQESYYNKSYEFAKLAFKLDPNNAEANFVMSISMGRMALIKSGQEKIQAVKDIKLYADRSVRLDPMNYKPYHVLGKWHYEVSSLSSFEKWLVKLTYGALPESSFEEAIKYYEKSRSLKPNLLINYVELAKTYMELNNKQKALSYLKAISQLPNSASDDYIVRLEAKKLLQKIESID